LTKDIQIIKIKVQYSDKPSNKSYGIIWMAERMKFPELSKGRKDREEYGWKSIGDGIG